MIEITSVPPINVLHLYSSPLAGAPVHLSKILNKYTSVSSKTVLRKTSNRHDLKNLQWDFDLIGPGRALLRDLVKQADIIHYHQQVYAGISVNSPSLMQYHASPDHYVPHKTHGAWNGKKLVIAQYHPQFYSDAVIVPNMIDIWDPALMPGAKSEAFVKIFFSWTSEKKTGWGRKASKRTMEIFQRIKGKYRDRVEIVVANNQPFVQCMAAKKEAHICIDECVTGSYHLQSLEGCSVGALTINNINSSTAKFLGAITGTNDHPFVVADLANLFDCLSYYIDHPQHITEKGISSRKWMEQFWNPVRLSQKTPAVLCKFAEI